MSTETRQPAGTPVGGQFAAPTRAETSTDLEPAVGGPNLDEQHPRNPDGTWQAHCTSCGTYVDDEDQEPADDFLCDDCQVAGD